MKYTIEGFSQRELVNLKLDTKDAILLRWMVDFYNTGKMDVHIFDGEQYVWIDYRYVIQDLPILGINSAKVMGRRLKHLQTQKVIEIRCFEAAGNRMYFKFNGQTLCRLISDRAKQAELTWGGSELKSSEGRNSKVPRVGTQKFRPVDPSTKDPSTKDPKESSPQKFVKPTLDDVRRYCQERSNKINPISFFNFYEANGWRVGRNTMRNWKAAVVTWEQRDLAGTVDNTPRKPPDPACTDCRGSGKVLAPGTGKNFPCRCTRAGQ